MNAEDLELDRLAARAAGIHLHHWNESLQRWMTSSVQDGDPDGSWNARDDDGDALRLAVRLRIGFRYEVNSPPGLRLPRECATAVFDGCWYAEAPQCGDEDGATRRAIVRAAAHIGSIQCRT